MYLCSGDLDLDPVSLIYKLHQDILLSKTEVSKVTVQTGQTDRHNWNYYHATFVDRHNKRNNETYLSKAWCTVYSMIISERCPGVTWCNAWRLVCMSLLAICEMTRSTADLASVDVWSSLTAGDGGRSLHSHMPRHFTHNSRQCFLLITWTVTPLMDDITEVCGFCFYFFNPFKPNGVKWLHFRVFRAILIPPF